MTLTPQTQTKLYHLDKYINELVDLYDKNILPNKILLSGQKGLGKSTMVYHFINLILSRNEDFPYDKKNFSINDNNKSYKLMLNQTLPNFHLIDVKDEKKNIDINQIRDLIRYSNKSSFNDKSKFILIDNIEFLNLNATNALLKIIEEPNLGVNFFLINNNKKILPTLRSRCLEFKIYLKHNECIEIINKIINLNILDIVNHDLINPYQTQGNLYKLYLLSKEFDIDLKNISLKFFLKKIIDEKYYRKKSYIKKIILEYIEMFFLRKSFDLENNFFQLYDHFLESSKNMDKYNLDDESFFIEFKSKVLNG